MNKIDFFELIKTLYPDDNYPEHLAGVLSGLVLNASLTEEFNVYDSGIETLNLAEIYERRLKHLKDVGIPNWGLSHTVQRLKIAKNLKYMVTFNQNRKHYVVFIGSEDEIFCGFCKEESKINGPA